MLDGLPDYSIEPDWMLQSSQISDLALICELVKEFYPGMARLARLLLEKPEKSKDVSRETIHWAIVNRHQFWGSTSLRVWLYGHVYKVCRALHWSKRSVLPFGNQNPRSFVAKLIQKQSPDNPDYSLGQALTRLSEQQQILLVLEVLEELTPDEIAQVMGGRERAGWVQQHLLSIHTLLFNQMGKDALPELGLKGRLKCLFQEALSLQALSTNEETALCADIEAQMEAGWRRKKFAIGGRELAIGGIVVALVIGLGLATNLMAPAPEPIPIKGNLAATLAAYHGVFVTPPSSAFGVFFLSTDFPSSDMFTPTPVTPPPPVQPLSMQSSLQEIENRMEQSRLNWDTMYAEALIVDYGPMGYIGLPQLYRNRLWFSQPSHLLVLAGPPENSPDYARIVIDNNYFEEDMFSGVAYYPKSIDFTNSQRASSVILSYALSYADRNRLYGYYLTDLLFSYNAISNATQIQLVGSDSFNGRNLLILRWIRAGEKEQVWVDALTGLVLGWRTFEPGNDEVVAKDIFMTSLALDDNFPVGLYSYRPTMSDTASWKDVWTPSESVSILQTEAGILSSAGRRAHIQAKPAPAGFDPSNSRLSFEWHTNPDGSLSSDISLISGEYTLGTLSMGDPWSLLCTRSPDGRTIVYIERPDIPIYAPKSVQWFRINDPSKVYPLYPSGYTASDVAFSPDSQQLVFFACSRNESDCGVFILNMQTQQSRKLINIGTGAYFAWSPDGQDLAMLGSDDLGSLRVFVIKVDTGEVVYIGPIDWKTFTTAANSPTRSWGVSFPATLGGLENCVLPPLP